MTTIAFILICIVVGALSFIFGQIMNDYWHIQSLTERGYSTLDGRRVIWEDRSRP